METNEPSPVVVIKQKELELAERQATAKRAAEQSILEARQWATDYRDRAERDGQEKAAAFYRVEIEACDTEAEKVRVDGELSARWIAERGSRGLDRAVQLIMQVVLPSPPSPGAITSSTDSRDSLNQPGARALSPKVGEGGE
jgi:vacuolar-type H+-ATPase subunit H